MIVVALFVLPILIADWRYRRIPNIYIIYITYWIIFMRIITGIASPITIALALAISTICVATMKMGIGDAKLLSIISLALNLSNISELLTLIICIYLAAVAQIILSSLHRRRIPASIPLAFAIFFGTGLYLAAGSSPSLQQYADALVNSW
ncbi:MAG: prepilin peptidase [Actinomycetota bacterium]|nr:prepilin peptidase [Actinomycetota bacterium]